MVDERGPRPHQRVAAAEGLEVRLRPGTAVPDGGEELRVESAEPGEVLGIGAVGLALAARDQRDLPRIGDDDVVPERREHPAQPRGPRPHLHHHPRARHPGERPRERRGRGADSLLPDDLPVVPEDADYRRWADPLMEGFERAARFLHTQHFYDAKFLPYGSQLIPLAALLTVLGRDWEPHPAREKLARWYWCGILGELYGGSIETRFARDLPEVVSWIRDGGEEPATIYDAEFAAARLLTLRTRNSAAYKGVYALLLREGARDWVTGEESSIQSYFDESIDIHHIFPQKWCGEHGIEPARCDSIVNKTPLTARTNRSIGGRAPGEYLARITADGVPRDVLDGYLRSHLIDPADVWSDDFDRHFRARQSALLDAIRMVMGKPIGLGDAEEPDDAPAEFELVQEDSLVSEDATS